MIDIPIMSHDNPRIKEDKLKYSWRSGSTEASCPRLCLRHGFDGHPNHVTGSMKVDVIVIVINSQAP